MQNAFALPKIKHLRRLVVFLILVAAFTGLLFVEAAGSEDRHYVIAAFGLCLIMAGILGRLWCILYIGDRKSVEIVEDGPYSICRNPLYVFSIIAAAGVGAQSGSIIIATAFAIGTWAIFHVVARREERFLVGRFGTAYRVYMSRVPRFWPAFALYQDRSRVEVSTQALYQTFKDGLVFLSAWPAFRAVELLQAAGILPVVSRVF